MEPIDLLNGKFKNVTINLGAKVKGELVTDANVEFLNDIEGQIVYDKKGNDIIITAFGTKEEGNEIVVNEKKILGKITIKNVGTKKIVEEQGTTYEASVTSNFLADNFFEELYYIGDPNSKKAQKLTGTYLNEHLWGGDGDDTIKAVGGDNTIDGGKGADKMYSGEGADTFEIMQGEALVNAKGKGGDIIYNSDSKDTLTWNNSNELWITKENNNLVIEDLQEAGTDKVTIDQFFASDDRISLANTNIDLTKEDIYIYGNEKKANILEGTEYNDVIIGGDKDDLISTGAGNDTITGGKGKDSIQVDGNGDKLIRIAGGDGAKSITVNSELSTEDTTVSTVFSKKDENDQIEYFYKKELNNLVINATHSDGTTDSLTVTNFFNLVTGNANDSVAGQIIVNNNVVANLLPNPGQDESIDVQGVKGSEIMNINNIKEIINEIVPGMGDTIEPILAPILKQIKLPASIKNAEVFLGSKYNDTMIGSTNKDVMVSFGGDNEFLTGTKGQTVIASLGEGENDKDTYLVDSFEAGTVIYDKDGKYDLLVNGVNANDIHMVSLSHLAIGGIAGLNLDSAEYLTDSKGVSNIANIDYRGTYNKVVNTIEEYIDEPGKIIEDLASHPENIAKKANSLINIAAGIVDKYRGLTIAEGNEGYELKDINIIDKKGLAQTISAKSQEAVQDATLQLLGKYMDDVAEIYQVDIEGETDVETAKNFGKLLLNPTAEEFRVDGDEISKEMKKYYTLVDKENNMYALNNTGCKAISNGLFDIFQNSYVGTNLDNSYVISNSAGGSVIASGTGNDTFTFKGELGNAYDPVYSIASSLNAGENDTIEIKNYSFSDLSLNAKDSIIVEDNGENGVKVALEGITMNANNYKKNLSATIGYQFGEEEGGTNITDSSFDGLTIKDSKNTYNFTAQHSSEEDIVYNWSENTDNHYAVTVADNVLVTSNNKNNIISSYSNESFAYTYGQGYDTVISNNSSDDFYNVELNMKGKDFKANLFIKDEGTEDHDVLLLNNDDISNLRLYFNVDAEGEVDETISLISKANLDKGKASFNFIIDKDNDGDNVDDEDLPEIAAAAKNGIIFDYHYEYDDEGASGIELVLYGKGEIKTQMNIDAVIDQVKQDIAGWEGWEKGYQSTDEVLANGSAKDVKEILAMYDNAYDTVMNQPV